MSVACDLSRRLLTDAIRGLGISVTDSAIRLDIPEHCVIVWVRIEASNALVLYVL